MPYCRIFSDIFSFFNFVYLFCMRSMFALRVRGGSCSAGPLTGLNLRRRPSGAAQFVLTGLTSFLENHSQPTKWPVRE